MKSAQQEILFNGTWQLRDEAIDVGADHASRIVAAKRGWIDQPVPGDVRQGLLAAGRITEPLLAKNSFDQVWIEERSWWLRKTFKLTAKDLAHDVAELELNHLDCNASIFLNGVHLGDHPSAFRPFVAPVKSSLFSHLREGENVLLVRLTHGLEGITPDMYEPLKGHQPTEANRGHAERGDRRRPFVRKPQCVWGWDWQPRVATVCINGDCRLRLMSGATIRDVQVVPYPTEHGAELDLTVSVQWLDPFATGRGIVRVAVEDADGKTVAAGEVDTLLQSGVNYIDMGVLVKKPHLWWPNGMGEPYRYTIKAEVDLGKSVAAYKPFRYGIRWIELLTEGEFTFMVNGERVFAKGGNWVPADAVYARVSDENYHALVAEAADANFNMLRIWGGGLYERDAFYEACDEHGIMIWHDFMFACSPYPDHLESFRDEVAKEADFQTRRLRNHASMALWCGSNEWLYMTGSTADGTKSERGARLLGEVLPAAVRKNCPYTPYWYTSPSGGEKPDSYEVGDCNAWPVPMMLDLYRRYDPKEFDSCDALFVSEFGYPGPLSLESTRRYLEGAPYDTTRAKDSVWMDHMNTFDGGALDVGLKRHYIDPLQASLEEYCYFGGLLQGQMYSYTLDSLRAKPQCSGSLFWMYNDAWPEVGWTIIDYYVRRKPSYWFVKRAFAPVKLICRQAGGKINVICANDTMEPFAGTIEFGYLSMDGQGKLRSKAISVKPMERKVVATFPSGGKDVTKGMWLARFKGEQGLRLPSATLWATEYRKRQLVQPTLGMSVAAASGKGAYVVTVSADAFAHAVELVLPDGAVPADNYFDLTPGETRQVTVHSKAKLTNKNVSIRTAWDWFSKRPEAKK